MLFYIIATSFLVNKGEYIRILLAALYGLSQGLRPALIMF